MDRATAAAEPGPTGTREQHRVRALDVLVPLLLCGIDLILSWNPHTPRGTSQTWLVLAYAVIGYSVLVVRRQHPLTVYGFVVLHNAAAWLVVPQYRPTLSVWLGLYAVAVTCDRRRALAALVTAALPATLNVFDEVRSNPASERLDVAAVSITAECLIPLAVFGLGRWVAWSIAQRRAIAERSAAAALARERARIARDLHDVVAHALTLMLLQAAGAARFVRKDPDRAHEALENVDALGQQAIVELQRMLSLLRLEPGDSPPSSPHGLGSIGDLVSANSLGRVRFDLEVVGDPGQLEPGVDLNAYRIVQEAVTNANRYAAAEESVTVQLAWSPDTLEIRVENRYSEAAARTSSRISSGLGLIGMQERAQSVGGTFSVTTPAPDRFVVTARLPASAHPTTRPTMPRG